MPGIREHDAPGSAPGHSPGRGPGRDPVNEVVRWSAFGCAVVPAVLLLCGSPLSGAAGAALGLGAVTAASHSFLRYYERAAARLGAGAASPHRGRHGRTGIGTHRGGRRS
ncbi:hypothetical protein [Streptomyces sp. NBRC 110028]|uniref:hypothetical protein n=1 Tax=Streptomyces sp. NBRC 110028 TaxID=1621260 RepID=UPI000AF00D8A|nr:hypothetical protein [Streptomyces sp. NBRC 110028]